MDNEIIEGESHELTTRREVAVRNPDDFDVGQSINKYNENGVPNRQDAVTRIATNPSQYIQSLDLTEHQLDNIVAAIAGIGAGIGAGLTTKHLSRTFGEEFAGMIGGALGGLAGGYAGKRIVHGRRGKRRSSTNYIE